MDVFDAQTLGDTQDDLKQFVALDKSTVEADSQTKNTTIGLDTMPLS